MQSSEPFSYVSSSCLSHSIFYQTYNQYVCSLAWKYCFDPQNVDDVIQKTWLALFPRISLVKDLSKAKQFTYISVTMQNVIRMEKRKKCIECCSLESVADIPYDGTRYLESKIEQAERAEHFRKAWNSVDEASRELLERKYILFETDAQIAEKLNIKPSSVRMYLSRARRAASKVLAEYHPQSR